MERFFIAFIFVIAALLFMAISLHLSRYKKRKTGCCSHGQDEGTKVSPQSCPVCSTGADENARE
jgi:hypothetical protein